MGDWQHLQQAGNRREQRPDLHWEGFGLVQSPVVQEHSAVLILELR